MHGKTFLLGKEAFGRIFCIYMYVSYRNYYVIECVLISRLYSESSYIINKTERRISNYLLYNISFCYINCRAFSRLKKNCRDNFITEYITILYKIE